MKKRIQAGLCLLLALCMLPWLAACAPTAVPEPQTQPQRLVVEETAPVYPPDFIARVSAEIADLVCRFERLNGAGVPSDAAREQKRVRVERDFLPVLFGAGLHPFEVDKLLEQGRECLSLLEGAEELASEQMTAELCRFYQRAVAVIDSARVGEIVYGTALLYLNDRIAFCEERYRNYGQQWYLQEAELRRAQLSALGAELDKERFADAVSVFAYCGSLLAGILPEGVDDGGEMVTDAFLLLMLRRQVMRFDQIDLTGEEWSLVASILPQPTLTVTDPLLNAELSLLQREGRMTVSFEAMPELLTLYAACARALGASELAALRGEDQLDRTVTVCRVLSRCETETLAALHRLSELAAGESAEELALIEKAGETALYQAFLESCPALDAEELMQAVTTVAESGDEGQIALLNRAVLGYLRGAAPCFAYALSRSFSQ